MPPLKNGLNRSHCQKTTTAKSIIQETDCVVFSCFEGIAPDCRANKMNKLFVAFLLVALVASALGSFCPTGRCGITNCKRHPDGLYQHCFSCKKYNICRKGRCIERCCPPDKVWDDYAKCCTWWSNTCSWDPVPKY